MLLLPSELLLSMYNFQLISFPSFNSNFLSVHFSPYLLSCFFDTIFILLNVIFLKYEKVSSRAINRPG